jgi:fructokinase
MIDPNVRPAVIEDRELFRERFEDIVRCTDVVKLSEADAAWLYPGVEADATLTHLLGLGAGLVAVTRGSAGAIAGNRIARVECASPLVAVADTVGAGDAFNAGVLDFLHANGLLRAGAPTALDSDAIGELLVYAAAVAALTCAETGASPPSRADVEIFLHRDL